MYSLAMLGIFLLSCATKNTSLTNLEIIKSTYEGKNSKENGENLQQHLALNASWTEANGFPYAGTYYGYNEIKNNVFIKLENDWVDYKFIPENYVAQDNTVIAYGTYYGTHKNTHKSFKARVAHLWKLENGKITSFEQFVDSKLVVDATINN